MFFKNIDDYNAKRKRKVLIVFDDMIADTRLIKNFNQQLNNYLLDAEN